MKLTPEIIQEISAYINEGIVKKRNKALKNDRESGGNIDDYERGFTKTFTRKSRKLQKSPLDVALRNKFERPLKAAKADPGITKMLSQNVSDKQLRNSRLKDKKHDYEGIPTGRKLNKILNKKNKAKT